MFLVHDRQKFTVSHSTILIFASVLEFRYFLYPTMGNREILDGMTWCLSYIWSVSQPYVLTCFFFVSGELFKWLNSSTPNWGVVFNIDFLHTNDFCCKATYFLRYYGQFFSSWLTVAITMERCLCVCSPFRVGITLHNSRFIGSYVPLTAVEYINNLLYFEKRLL